MPPIFASLCRHRSNTCRVEFSSHSFKPDWYCQLSRQTRRRAWYRFRGIVCSSAFLTWDLASSERDQSCWFELIDQRSGLGCQLASRDPNTVALIAATYPSIPTQFADWNRWHVWSERSRINHGFMVEQNMFRFFVSVANSLQWPDNWGQLIWANLGCLSLPPAWISGILYARDNDPRRPV
jgi:hypothetical protein